MTMVSILRDGEVVEVPYTEVFPPPPPITKADLIAHAAAKRFALETAGIVVGGSPIRTDRESQALISGAFTLAKEEPDEPITFKGEGGFVQIDSATMILIGIAVGRHVRNLFAVEAEVVAAIDAGTITSIQQIDDHDWSGS